MQGAKASVGRIYPTTVPRKNTWRINPPYMVLCKDQHCAKGKIPWQIHHAGRKGQCRSDLSDNCATQKHMADKSAIHGAVQRSALCQGKNPLANTPCRAQRPV